MKFAVFVRASYVSKFLFWTSFSNQNTLWLFVVLCGYSHKNQRGLEVKIILSTGNDEEPTLLFR